MSNEDIKAACENAYIQIATAQKTLEDMRKICRHESRYRGTYSWRPGCYNPADICEYCGDAKVDKQTPFEVLEMFTKSLENTEEKES